MPPSADPAAAASRNVQPPTDRELLHFIQHGSPDESRWAMNQLFQKYYLLVLRSILAKLSRTKQKLAPQDEAEDIAMNTWMWVLDNIFIFQWPDQGDEYALRAWIMISAGFHYLTWRHDTNHTTYPLEGFLNELSYAMDESEPIRELHKLVLAEIERLPEKPRQIIQLRFQSRWEPMSHQEIAEIMGEAPGTVRQAYNRALKRIGARLQANGFAISNGGVDDDD